MSKTEAVTAVVVVLIIAGSFVMGITRYTAARRYQVEQSQIKAAETRMIQEAKTERTKQRMQWIPWYKSERAGDDQ